MNGKTVTVEQVYYKLEKLEEHIMALEHALIPELKMTPALAKKIATARKNMQAGGHTTLSELKEKYK